MEADALLSPVHSEEKKSISKYCKLAVVLLINALPVWFTISVAIDYQGDSDFLGLGLLMNRHTMIRVPFAAEKNYLQAFLRFAAFLFGDVKRMCYFCPCI
jgi:hypothetical protein